MNWFLITILALGAVQLPLKAITLFGSAEYAHHVIAAGQFLEAADDADRLGDKITNAKNAQTEMKAADSIATFGADMSEVNSKLKYYEDIRQVRLEVGDTEAQAENFLVPKGID